MIKKLNVALLAVVLALVLAKLAVGLKQTPSSAVVAASARPAPADGDEALAPTVFYETWVPYTVENPTTARNGYILDVIRAVFPRARFVRTSLTVERTRELLESDPNSVCAIYGDHPALAGFPRAPTPLMEVEMVVYTRRSLAWTYRGEKSLAAIRLGVAEDYLDSPGVRAYVAHAAGTTNAVQVFREGSAFARNEFLAIDRGVVDGVVRSPIDFSAANLGQTAEMLVKYSVSPPIDRATVFLTASNADAERAKCLVEAFERGMRRIESSGELRRIRDYYARNGDQAESRPAPTESPTRETFN